MSLYDEMSSMLESALVGAEPKEHTRWNLWLVNCGEPPLLYFNGFSEDEAQAFIKQSAEKAFDGSDADGFVMMRSDYPVPAVWPEHEKLDFTQLKARTPWEAEREAYARWPEAAFIIRGYDANDEMVYYSASDEAVKPGVTFSAEVLK